MSKNRNDIEKQKKFDKSMMKTAKIWAKESTCKKKKVGAVLAKDGRILVTGKNGTISGMECNICEEYIPLCKESAKKLKSEKKLPKNIKECYKCNGSGVETLIYGPYGDQEECYVCKGSGYLELTDITSDHTLHAEENIIVFAAREGISVKDCTLYVTLSPCLKCSRMIVQAGIKRVVYKEKYRDTSGIDFLKKHGVKVDRYKKDK